MNEIDAMKALSEAFENLGTDERGRVLAWALSKYGGGEVANPSAMTNQPVGKVKPGPVT